MTETRKTHREELEEAKRWTSEKFSEVEGHLSLASDNLEHARHYAGNERWSMTLCEARATAVKALRAIVVLVEGVGEPNASANETRRQIENILFQVEEAAKRRND